MRYYFNRGIDTKLMDVTVRYEQLETDIHDISIMR